MPRAQTDEVAMLRTQIEMLMAEREGLLRTVGAASVFVANLTAEDLPEDAIVPADVLASSLNALSEDTLRDALETVRPELEDDEN